MKPRRRPHVFASDGVDRHFYELCALAELRDRLRAGDIWVTGIRQYRDFETYLIPTATFKVMQKEPLPLDVATRLPSYLAECRQRPVARPRGGSFPDGLTRTLRSNAPKAPECAVARVRDEPRIPRLLHRDIKVRGWIWRLAL